MSRFTLPSIVFSCLALGVTGVLAVDPAPPAIPGPIQAKPASSQNRRPQPETNPMPIRQFSLADDAARYLAGISLSPGSNLQTLMQDPRWIAHGNAMNNAFSTLEQRQINNIRVFRSLNIAPTLPSCRNCLYLFGGPDFLYADAMYPDCTTYVLQGLESVDPLPDLLTVPQPALLATLQNIEISINSLVNFTFFETKDMRSDFQRSQLKGVLPIIFVFLARSGKQVQGVEYISLDKGGRILQGGSGSVHGARITFFDPAGGVQKTLYYFTSDLSDEALRANPAVLRFCSSLGPSNSLLKAASYLMHEGNFGTVRNFILQRSSAIVEDDSGIPIRYFTPDHWVPRFFGVYSGPIDLFRKYYQPDLRNLYAASSPKPLTFGFGYQFNPKTSGLILAIRK
jgi:hypothetical protein